jgi:hypothetical protein
MIRELHITDDRGVKRPVLIDDLLVGEPWNAARSTEQPTRVAPAIYRTWSQRLILGGYNCIAALFLANVLRGILGVHYLVALALIVCTGTVVYAVHRRYGAQMHGMFWRRRLARRTPTYAARQHARLSIAREGVCPCCAYSLADTPPDPDGCMPCPECGAAWRVHLWSNDAGIYRPPAVTPTGQSHHRSRITASDARGVIVPLLARRKDIDRHEALRVCPARPARVRQRLSLLAWAIHLSLTAAVAWLIITLAQPEHLLAWSGTVIMIAFAAILLAALVGITYSHNLAFASHPHLIRAMVADGTCPCCESPLRPERSPIDACHLCDTCGSAWNPPQPA